MSAYDPMYSKRWRLDRHRGITRLVDAAPARANVERLRDQGASMRAIAEVAGVAPSVVSRLSLHPGPKLRRDVAARLTAVSMDAVRARANPAGFVPNLGARRRIRALLALGWRHTDITTYVSAVGTHSAMVLHQRGDWIARATHDAVVAAYDELGMRRGPSQRTRNRALAGGYAPPLAWDDNAIDEPDARPNLYGSDTKVVDAWLAGYPPDDLDSVDDADRHHVIHTLHAWGHTDPEITRLTGIDRNQLWRDRQSLDLPTKPEPGRPVQPKPNPEAMP